jgi:hypothetical protein
MWTLPCEMFTLCNAKHIALRFTLWNVYRACPARPVAPGDGTGVGSNYRTGAECFFLFNWGLAYSIRAKPIY